jgi:hypothetical protein
VSIGWTIFIGFVIVAAVMVFDAQRQKSARTGRGEQSASQSTSAPSKTVDITNMYPVGIELVNTYRGPDPISYSLSEVRSRLERMGYKCNDDKIIKGVKGVWAAAWQIKKNEEIQEENEFYYYDDDHYYYYDDTK